MLSKLSYLALSICLICTTVHGGWLKVIDYKEPKSGETLKLHIAYPPDHKPTDKRPAVIFFFGGGWMRGKPGQFYPYIQDMRDLGIVGISAQYRTKESHNANPVDCVMDGKSAIRYVREHAREMGIDPDRIIAGGGSAGGHVAASTAIADGPEDIGENLDVSSRPAALLLLNPVISVGPDGYRNDYVASYIDDWQKVSPLESVDADFPPTLIQVGTKDKILPPALANSFKEKMSQTGNDCEVVFYQGAGHGFFNKPEYRPSTVEKMKEFLKRHDFLE